MHTQDRLESWKAISAHLKRTVRTVQRWERDLGLPVHRIPGRKRDMVYALASELDQWLHTREGARALAEPQESDSGEVQAAQPRDANTASALLTPVTTHRAKFARARPKQWLWVSAVALAGLVAYVGLVVTEVLPMPVWAAGRNPADWDVDERHVIALDKNGREIWRYKFEHVLGVGHYRDMRADGRTPTAGVYDLDGDGRNEVLIAPAGTKPGAPLYCFNSDGKIRFKRSVERSHRFGQHNYSGYNVHAFRITRNADGAANIWIVAVHHTEFPTVVAKLDAQGNILGEFWHAGHDADLEQSTFQGRRVMVVGYLVNDGKRAGLAAIDYDNPTGFAPAQNDHYQCKTCPSGSPLAYYIFPRTEYADATQSLIKANDVRPADDGSVTVAVGQTEIFRQFLPVTAFYKFDANLNLVEAFWGSDSPSAHERFRIDGLINHRYHSSEEHSLFPALRWNGSEFEKVTGPGHEGNRQYAGMKVREQPAKSTGRRSVTVSSQK